MVYSPNRCSYTEKQDGIMLKFERGSKLRVVYFFPPFLTLLMKLSNTTLQFFLFLLHCLFIGKVSPSLLFLLFESGKFCIKIRYGSFA